LRHWVLNAAVALARGHIVILVLGTVAFGFAGFARLLLVVQVRRVVGAVGALLGNVVLLAFLMAVRLEIVGAYFFVHMALLNGILKKLWQHSQTRYGLLQQSADR
jgi:hypothetical protein